MPLVTAHLIALTPGRSINEFVKAISATNIRPLVIARVIRWIIKPEVLSVTALLDVAWDILILLPETSPIPKKYGGKDWISAHWTITAGVPSSLVNHFDEKNKQLLQPTPRSIPALTGSLEKPRIATSAQGLELSEELLSWSQTFARQQPGAVSMLNLLAFKSDPSAHENYLKYGKAFADSIGSRRGGLAKIVGKVVPGRGTPGEDQQSWDEIALAHYPSIHHFADMLGSEDYQAVNHRHRLPSLKDTCILCTSELDPSVIIPSAKL